ncbi:MAG: hypothetical protein RL077_2729 [Verrucomicrobiota bacterium]|jgi:hypothetical protein
MFRSPWIAGLLCVSSFIAWTPNVGAQETKPRVLTEKPAGPRVAYLLLVNGAVTDAVVKAANIGSHKTVEGPYVGTWHGFLKGMDAIQKGRLDAHGTMNAMDRFNQQAISLLTSPRAREAFDLSREPDKLRERYGRHSWGQRALMARRLVEAGCSFVTVALENPNVANTYYNWDTHAVNHDNFIDMRNRLPIYDKALTALIEDLHDRGLTKKVLLVVTGEFGRSPRVSISNGPKGRRYGREHWPGAMSVLVAGGGMQHGQVVGSTNSKGEYPEDRPLTPADLWATVYRHLGINQDATIPYHTGRPQFLLPSGEPIRELI